MNLQNKSNHVAISVICWWLQAPLLTGQLSRPGLQNAKTLKIRLSSRPALTWTWGWEHCRMDQTEVKSSRETQTHYPMAFFPLTSGMYHIRFARRFFKTFSIKCSQSSITMRSLPWLNREAHPFQPLYPKCWSKQGVCSYRFYMERWPHLLIGQRTWCRLG